MSAPGASAPDVLEGAVVTASEHALVLRVRHAQDIDAAVFEGDWDWAIASVRLRRVDDFEESQAALAFEGVISSSGGRLVLGDADSEVTVNDLTDITRVRVFVVEDANDSATEIHIELAPEASS